MKRKISDKKEAGKEKSVKTPATVTMKQETTATVQTGQASPEVIQNIELSMIVCSPFNPRKYRGEEDLEELRQSIVNFGIIQPVTLRVKGEQYEIVCGERRYRASLMAEKTTIPAIIKEYSDAEAMEICILENLQRRDINPVEEALSFGKLMEVRGYSIEDLVRQFGKTDKYIRSRLQLRNLADEIAGLLVREEITLAIALELARFCPDIQRDVYESHLSADDNYSWKNLQAKDFRKMLEGMYSTDLSRYEFDKADCKACPFNSSVYDLFADGNCGNCQNIECLRYKQAEFVASETTRLLNERKNENIGICVAPDSFASAEVVENLIDTGCEIYEMQASRLPEEPQKPEPEQFASEAEYREAEAGYESRLQQYRASFAQIEEMVEQGKAQLLVDVSRCRPELCYRVIPEAEASLHKNEEDTVEKLRRQDTRNKEIAIEKGVEEVKRLVKESVIPAKDFSPREQELLYFIMLAFLRRENYDTFGIEDRQAITDEEKLELVAFRSIEQENVIRRDFIIHALSQASGDCLKSRLLLEFVAMYFPNKVTGIKQQCNEAYRKKHERIEERILQLQPYNSENTEEADAKALPAITGSEETSAPDVETATGTGEDAPEPETFDNPDMDDIPLYPGLPEQAQIGEVPDDDGEIMETAYEEAAA
ncbi:ParB/RepB/Spo0J family partition protein [Dysgonomonas reticulitermitis]